MPILFLFFLDCFRKSFSIENFKFVRFTIVIDCGHGTCFFRMIYKYDIVTLGLGVNDNQSCC